MASEFLRERVGYNIYMTSCAIEEYLGMCGVGAALVLSRHCLCGNKAVNQANVHFFGHLPQQYMPLPGRQAAKKTKQKKKEKKMQRKHHSPQTCFAVYP